MTPEERQRLQAMRELGTMNQAQALAYFELLKKEEESSEVQLPVPVAPVVEGPKKKAKK